MVENLPQSSITINWSIVESNTVNRPEPDWTGICSGRLNRKNRMEETESSWDSEDQIMLETELKTSWSDRQTEVKLLAVSILET